MGKKKPSIPINLTNYTDFELEEMTDRFRLAAMREEVKIKEADAKREAHIEVKNDYVAAQRAIRQELDKRWTIPKSPPSGSVIRFGRNLGGKTYHYAAIEVAGFWYLTGEHTAPKSWRRMVEFIQGDETKRQSHLIYVYPGGTQTPTCFWIPAVRPWA